MEPYAVVDYNLTLCPLHSRLLHIYQGQPYARVDFNPLARAEFIPQSGTLDLAYDSNITWLSTTVLFLLKNIQYTGIYSSRWTISFTIQYILRSQSAGLHILDQ